MKIGQRNLLLISGISALLAVFVGLFYIYGNARHTGIAFLKTAHPAAVGYIPGELAVSPTGTPSFTIQIASPPGINGVEPHIELAYTNAASNGILGVGWNLNGLSIISRTGKSIPQDGIKSGVTLTIEDRFNINGQRLIAYKDKDGNLLNTLEKRNAAYGKEGTEYRTEIESWVRVYSKGSCDGGPCSFVAHHKDGSVMEFANSTDSKQRTSTNAAISSWAVNRITDRNGNYITVSYHQDSGIGAIYPYQIRYTGNSTTDLKPQRLIQFEYERRQDSIIHYLAGEEFSCNKRLRSISTFVDRDGNGKKLEDQGNLVKQYLITYRSGAATKRSVIDSITACDVAGNCMAATTFNWSGAEPVSLFSDTLSALPQGFAKALSNDVDKVRADFDGDGKIDIALLQSNATTIPILSTNAKGGFDMVYAAVPSGYSSYLKDADVEVFTADFNGDGLTDLLFFKHNSNKIPILYSQGRGKFGGMMVDLPPDFNTLINQKTVKKILGDFNGDGLPDIAGFKIGNSKVPILSVQPDGTFRGTLAPLPADTYKYLTADGTRQESGDFNGDGLVDIVIFKNGYKSIPILFSDGKLGFRVTMEKAPENVSPYLNANGVKQYLGDFNGDGVTDISIFLNGLKSVPVLYAKGDGNFRGDLLPIPDGNQAYINSPDVQQVLGDINGDGVTDIIAFKNGLNKIPALISNAQNQFNYSIAPIPSSIESYINDPGVNRFIGDFNGDGLVDIAAIKRGFTSMPVLVSHKFNNSNNKPDLLLEINNGIGAVSKINYKPITDSTVYAASKIPVTYPLLEKQFPHFVVSNFEKIENPQKPSSRLRYELSYSGAIIDQYRGFMGFRNKLTTDEQTQSIVNERYQVAFPYLGVSDQKVIVDRANPSQVLGKTFYQYASQEVHSSGVYQLWNTVYELQHYTKGNFNYTTRKEFIYDDARRSIIQINDLGEVGNPQDDTFTYFRISPFDENSPRWWTSFYPLDEKAKSDTTALVSWDKWMPGDLYWKKFRYDSKMNVWQNTAYLNTNGSDIQDTWVGKSFTFDEYGNTTSLSTLSNANKTDSIRILTVYDPVFHTFPVMIKSPENNQGKRLISYYTFDPRFGIKVQETDPNGNILYHIPANGMDGFGRILTAQSVGTSGQALVNVSVFNYQRLKESGYSVHSYTATDWSSLSSPDSTWLYKKDVFDGFERTVNRELNSQVQNQQIASPVSYDMQGRVSRQYLPYYTGEMRPLTGNDTLHYQNVYDRHGYLKQVLAPSPDGSGGFVISKEFIRDEKDDRIVYVKTPSPENDQKWVYYKKRYDVKARVVEKSGPYVSIGTEGANFGRVSFVYNALDQLTETVDQLGEKHRYQYNSLGNLINEYSPSTDTTRYSFNANSLMISSITPGGKTEWNYDNLARVIRKTIKNNKGSINSEFNYTYDSDSASTNSMGRLSKVASRDFSYTYGYDNRGNVVSKSVRITHLTPVFVHVFSYDAANRLLSCVYPDNSRLDYNYDLAGNISRTIYQGDTLSVYSKYAPSGEVGQVKYANGISSSFRHDVWGRLTESKTEKGAYQLYETTYHWSKANKLLEIADIRDVAEMDMSQTFTYSLAGRLKSASGAYGQESYSYNASGDQLTRNEDVYTYDAKKKHQLVNVSRDQQEMAHYAYSADGSLQSKRVISSSAGKPDMEFRYHFDGDGSLRAVSSGVDTVSKFTYNDKGIRIAGRTDSVHTYYISPYFEATILKSSKMLYTKYVHDEQGVIYSETVNENEVKIEGAATLLKTLSTANKTEGSFIYLFFGTYGWLFLGLAGGILVFCRAGFKRFALSFSGSWRSSWSVWKKFQWATLMIAALILTNAHLSYANLTPGKNGAGIPVENEKRFYHHNQIGSTSLVTDKNGGLTNSISYKPYGAIDDVNSTGEDNFRAKFTGKELDEALGLYYFGSRYYDGQLGRFISPDPANQYFSPYIYGNGDPLSGIDPDGELFFEIALVVGLIVGAYLGASIANGNFNPAQWHWAAAETWVGLITGAAAGVAVVASSGAALSAFGAVAAESVAIGTTSAATVAFTAADVAFLTYDSYSFAQEPSLVNGLFVALDAVPFGGALIGKASKGAKALKAETTLIDREMQIATKGESEAAYLSKTCPMSFPQGTLVQTEEGAEKIEQIDVGDEILGWDTETASFKKYAVTKLFKRVATGLVIFTVGCCDTIVVTPEHPIYTATGEWVEARFLTEKSSVLSLNRNHQTMKPGTEKPAYLPVRSVRMVPDTTLVVYNFEVEKAHNYFVSQSGILVHNPPGCGRVDLGGRHGTTKKNSEKFLVESNHFPASSSYEGTPYSSISYDDRPAITMDYEDHRIANSTGSSHAAKAWRAKQTALLKSGKFAEAMAMDIQNMKAITNAAVKDRTYLAQGMEEAVDYAHSYKHGGQPLISAKERKDLIKLIWQ